MVHQTTLKVLKVALFNTVEFVGFSECRRFFVIDTARIVLRSIVLRSRVYETVRCLSVSPSVSLSHSPASAACGGFAAVGQAGRRYRSITCRSGAVVGVRIGSWTQTCFAVSFACSADTSCVVAEMVRVLVSCRYFCGN